MSTDRTPDSLHVMVSGKNLQHYRAEASRLDDNESFLILAEEARQRLLEMRAQLMGVAESSAMLAARSPDRGGRTEKRADEALALVDEIDKYLGESDESPPPSFLDKLNAKVSRKKGNAKAEAKALGTGTRVIDRDTRKPDPRAQYDGELVKSLAAEFKTCAQHVVNTLNLSGGLEEGWTNGVLVRWFREYRKGRKAGAESRESVALANALALI